MMFHEKSFAADAYDPEEALNEICKAIEVLKDPMDKIAKKLKISE
jgi:hypothetical protein